MKKNIEMLIAKWNIELAYKEGQEGLQEGLRVGGKPTRAEVDKIKELKLEIIAELKRRAAEAEAARAAEEAARQEEIRALKAGEKPIVLHWHDGDYLSGWEVFGEAGKLLEKIGLARFVDGWGHLVIKETVDALGQEFTYPEAVEYTRPVREENEAEQAATEAARQAKFDEARETGEPVLLHCWSEHCNDPREECSLDIVRQYAMPDGSVKIGRHHTW